MEGNEKRTMEQNITNRRLNNNYSVDVIIPTYRSDDKLNQLLTARLAS